MARRFSPRFAMYVAIVFLLLGVVQLIASLIFYQAIDRQTLWDDHARRVAELLVVSDRVHAIAPADTAARMTTRHLAADVAARPAVSTPPADDALATIAEKIIAWEPSLAGRSLSLATASAHGGRKDLIGSIRLADGNWLNFRSQDLTTMWPVALRATALTFVSAIACLCIGLIAIHLLAKPLRRLTDAAEAIGQGREVAIRESGPQDLRDLAHAMNGMQARITRLLQDQAKAFEAISHDLRTPLARLEVVSELVDDPQLVGIVQGSVEEMDELLSSLQKFLRAQHLSATAEDIALLPFLREILTEFGDRVAFDTAHQPVVRTFREPLALAVTALVENAVQFGQQASVSIERVEGSWTIAIEDHGPGIPPDYFDAILEPFFRLDEARQRQTKGFGLGIPTAHRLMMRFDGKLSFAVSERGGLIARLQLPVA